MAGYHVIADVSERLLELIRDGLRERSDVLEVDPSSVAVVSPSDVDEESDIRLGLYLYSVTENPTMANADRSRVSDTRHRDPPLALDLQYLLTAYPGSSDRAETVRSLTQQRLLGFAMQLLHDDARIDPADLPGVGEADVSPQISVTSEPLDVVTGLWTSFEGAAFAPSVTYQVGPVLIESANADDIPEVERRETRTDRKPDPRTDDRR